MARNGATHVPTMLIIIICFAIIVEFHATVFKQFWTLPYYVAAENLKECYEKCRILYQNNSKEKEQCRERCHAKYSEISDNPLKACILECKKLYPNPTPFQKCRKKCYETFRQNPDDARRDCVYRCMVIFGNDKIMFEECKKGCYNTFPPTLKKVNML
ncbi:uncharacterized protein LOC107478139 [Arachis duranensis]|uniref:Uncharacterized protein LOC107478139 n=1 Tax=Arachis duranensis TaxID=130453 RepID=A0A6P4CMY8_ARADU|nr:uncharacterized protein LOC107478139 [Arachis duranensis]